MRFFKNISPLTARILAVNSLPLVILVVSILYFSGYQNRLIQNELNAMLKEASQFAAALGEGAVIMTDDERDILAPELALMIAQRLVDTAGLEENDTTRTRLFDVRGSQLVDTQKLSGLRSSVLRLPLLPPDQMLGLNDLWERMEGFLRRRAWPQDYARYKESHTPNAEDYKIVDEALDGDNGKVVWLLPDGHILLGVAVPIQRYKSVLGSVFMTRKGDLIEKAISDVRMDILKLFCLTLAFTILISLYLARTLARPLRELAHAAKGLEAGTGSGAGNSSGALKWQQSIPDFSNHKDEIGDLSLALRAMVKALGERMHATERFAADVAHEIKNPLTSLHSAVETAQKITDPERQKKLMLVIAEDVRRLDRLITDISQASRLEAELTRANPEKININNLLEMVIGLYTDHEWTDNRNVQVVLDNKDETVGQLNVRGIETRLAQVFQNLIDNAVSFTPQGGRVTLCLHRFGMAVVVRVEDEGIGIPENKLEAVFDRFYTERPAGEKFGQHSGLGLNIARQIVEAHKGRIWAENISDGTGGVKGAAFNVELPLV